MTDVIQAGEALENASQKHEKELVIEFGPDRILQYIGVYLVASLAVIAKISELAGDIGRRGVTGNSLITCSFFLQPQVCHAIPPVIHQLMEN